MSVAESLRGSRTLFEVLQALAHCTTPAYTFHVPPAGARTSTWAELVHKARRFGAALQGAGVEAGEPVLIVADDAEAFVSWFWGAVAIGAIPAPVGAMRLGMNEARYAQDLVRRMEVLGASTVCSGAPVPCLQEQLRPQGASALRALCADATLGASAREWHSPIQPSEDATCFVQFTSGSTRAPRGIAVSHRNLLHNIRASALALGIAAGGDVGVSWLPLHHDFGLVGSVLTPAVHAATTVFLPTLSFATRPQLWLELVSQHKATLTASSNYGLHLACKRPPKIELDLSGLRALVIGGEMIEPELLERFAKLYAPSGLRPDALRPSYGLAESTLAVTVDGAHDAALATRVHVSPRGARCIPCGPAIAGTELRIAPLEGAPDEPGRILVRGLSVARQFAPRGGSSEPLCDEHGWLDTGDMGLVRDGRLFVAGRIKDVIILAGENHYPDPIEQAVSSVEGVRKACVAAFGVADAGHERLVVVAEAARLGGLDAVRAEVRRRIRESFGLDAEIVIAKPWAIHRTTSGKVQRASTRTAYLQGALELQADAIAAR